MPSKTSDINEWIFSHSDMEIVESSFVCKMCLLVGRLLIITWILRLAGIFYLDVFMKLGHGSCQGETTFRSPRQTPTYRIQQIAYTCVLKAAELRALRPPALPVCLNQYRISEVRC